MIHMEGERMLSFLASLEKDSSPLLQQIEEDALKNDVPIIRQETGSLLRFLIALHKPARILEVGTATGYSALTMWDAAKARVRIDTIEKYEKRIPIAKANFEEAGCLLDGPMVRRNGIYLYEGDATEILASLEGSYDMIFMDAAKGQYGNFLEHVTRLLAPGGLLVSDNVLQEGDILESRYAVCRRDRTIHSRMREYLYELKHSEIYETTILNIGDGMALSVKVGEETIES
ncbi:MAG: O-methyltransferase [Lachnospiraceae bacterium]|nr:O-methyltransferase [Lachnospiraceae bacterium]